MVWSSRCEWGISALCNSLRCLDSVSRPADTVVNLFTGDSFTALTVTNRFISPTFCFLPDICHTKNWWRFQKNVSKFRCVNCAQVWFRWTNWTFLSCVHDLSLAKWMPADLVARKSVFEQRRGRWNVSLSSRKIQTEDSTFWASLRLGTSEPLTSVQTHGHFACTFETTKVITGLKAELCTKWGEEHLGELRVNR